MTMQDQVISALCAWREARGGGSDGMQSVLNVLQNRAARRGTSIYAEVVRKWQFSSMTAPGDPELIMFPTDIDPQWQVALRLAQSMADGTLSDITDGAIGYYALSMTTPPAWAVRMTPTVTIAGQKFYR